MDRMGGVLYFDGRCGMCTRARALLLRLDRSGGALRTEPLQTPGTAELFGISDDELLDTLRWRGDDGTVSAGAYAVNDALSTAWRTRWPSRIAALGPVGRCQEAVYRWVARNRHRFPGATPYCERHPAGCVDQDEERGG